MPRKAKVRGLKTPAYGPRQGKIVHHAEFFQPGHRVVSHLQWSFFYSAEPTVKALEGKWILFPGIDE